MNNIPHRNHKDPYFRDLLLAFRAVEIIEIVAIKIKRVVISPQVK